MSPVRDALLTLLGEAFDRKSWHGTNLRGSIRRVDAVHVVFRPQSERHSIWELVVHAAYWKYAVRRRIRREARGSFALVGSNWFPRPDRFDLATWKADCALLALEHRLLYESVAALTDRDLTRRAGGGQSTVAWLVRGAAAHDLYHAGQIQLLKKLASVDISPTSAGGRK